MPRVRPAGLADLDTILRMLEVFTLSHTEWDPGRFEIAASPRDAYREALSRAERGEGLLMLIAEGDPPGVGVVGYLMAELFAEDALTWSTSHVYIHDIYLDPDARAAGAGRLLARAAMEWARAQGVRQVRALTARANVDGRSFFASLGYRESAVEMAIDL